MIMDDFKKLSKEQQEVYDLFYNQGYSISYISNRRKVSYQAINKTIKKLIRKGLIEKGFKGGLKREMPIIMGGGLKYFRVHNIHLLIEPYYFYERYNKVKHSIGIPLKQWTITFNKSNIEVQLKKKASFDDEDLEKAIGKTREGITNIIYELQDKYGFEAFKEGKCNIRLVNQHIAEVENGIAKTYEGVKLRIYSDKGEVWALVDKSTGKVEFETVHPETNTDDMRTIQPYLNDWRDNKPPRNSDLLKELVLVAKNQAIYNENIKLHLEVLKDMKDTLKEIKEGFSKENRRLGKDGVGSSKPSGQFDTSFCSKSHPSPKTFSLDKLKRIESDLRLSEGWAEDYFNYQDN